MQIIDITKQSIEKSNEEYFHENKNLFEHYFKYWADKKTFKIKQTEKEIYGNKSLIVAELKRIENSFELAGLPLSNSKIILFVGQGTTNGHSFKDNDEFITWIPIELYSTKSSIDVFIPHEIIHTLHYTKNPDFYFNDIYEKNDSIRLLITEGIATYITKVIFKLSDKDALWADFMNESTFKEWEDECLKNIDLMSQTINSNKENIFETNENILSYKNRGGYYLGLKIITNLCEQENITLDELLNTPRIIMIDKIMKVCGEDRI